MWVSKALNIRSVIKNYLIDLEEILVSIDIFFILSHLLQYQDSHNFCNPIETIYRFFDFEPMQPIFFVATEDPCLKFLK